MKNSFLSGMDLGCRAYNVEGQRRMFCIKRKGHGGRHKARWWIKFRKIENPWDKYEKQAHLIPDGPRRWRDEKG